MRLTPRSVHTGREAEIPLALSVPVFAPSKRLIDVIADHLTVFGALLRFVLGGLGFRLLFSHFLRHKDLPVSLVFILHHNYIYTSTFLYWWQHQ